MFKIVNQDNIDKEHICCALGEKKGEQTTSLKKQWMKEQFDHGLVFYKLDVRGKVFIEYMPAENAFVPIVADDCLYINCLWVSGQYKGQGYGNLLLDHCINDAREQNKKGVVVLSSEKKRHFLSEPSHLKKYGFKVVDVVAPDFELLYYPLEKGVTPSFKLGKNPNDNRLYYSHQCPHTEKYVQLVKEVADQHGIQLHLERLHDVAAAKKSPSPFTTYALFLDGNFVTTEVLTEKRFIEVLKKHMMI